MTVVKVQKVKTEWRGVEFDGSQGSESYDDVDRLFDWAQVRGHVNCLNDYMPCIEVPVKKPTYPGETRCVYVQHGGWIVASNRGKVLVLTADEYYEKFEEKTK